MHDVTHDDVMVGMHHHDVAVGMRDDGVVIVDDDRLGLRRERSSGDAHRQQ